MDNYRIIEYSSPFNKTYKVQKKSFFGLWYNFNNIDAYTTGYYDTESDAKDAIDRHRSKTTATIIDV